MVNYYYNKYNAVANTTTSYSDGPWEAPVYSVITKGSPMYPSYTFDYQNGYRPSGTSTTVSGTPTVGWYLCNFTSRVYQLTGPFSYDSEEKVYRGNTIAKRSNPTSTTTYSCGSLIQSNIVATDGTYPTYGRYSDGYWYIKGSIVNAAPTLILATSSNQTIIESQSILLPNKNNFVLKITPNDVDASDTLQYSVLLRATTVVSYTTCTKGTVIDYTIPFTSLLLGNNTVQVKVKDSNGVETIRNLVLRLKAPSTLSQKGVKDALTAMGYPNTSFGCLKDLKPASYPYSTTSLAEIINSLS